MAKYTTELRSICEQVAGLKESVGYDDVNETISLSREKIFSFDYPLFDPEYKPVLETKILKHFYTREICAETYGRWKLFLDARMNEIMPYYNKLYESELIKYNPLYTHDLKTKLDGTKDLDRTDKSDTVNASNRIDENNMVRGGWETENHADNTKRHDDLSNIRDETMKNNQWDLYSDTPQGGINGIQDAEDDPSLATDGYLTNARHIIGDTTGTQIVDTGDNTYNTDNVGSRNNVRNLTDNAKNKSAYNSASNYGEAEHSLTTDDYLTKVYGYAGYSPSRAIQDYRKTFLNIDLQIIKELEGLFFLLW